MKKYLDFLSEQNERTAFNHQKPEAVRDASLDPFWNAIYVYLDEVSVVQERRHSDKMYIALSH